MAEPEDVEVDLQPDDYTTERYAASSGAGGQHVNKTASAIRLVHKEQGLKSNVAKSEVSTRIWQRRFGV